MIQTCTISRAILENFFTTKNVGLINYSPKTANRQLQFQEITPVRIGLGCSCNCMFFSFCPFRKRIEDLCSQQISQCLVMSLLCMKVHILPPFFLVHNIRVFSAYFPIQCDLAHSQCNLRAYLVASAQICCREFFVNTQNDF